MIRKTIDNRKPKFKEKRTFASFRERERRLDNILQDNFYGCFNHHGPIKRLAIIN